MPIHFFYHNGFNLQSTCGFRRLSYHLQRIPTSLPKQKDHCKRGSQNGHFRIDTFLDFIGRYWSIDRPGRQIISL